ncbi:MAG: tRNA dihydrouridine synthase DusB [Candidatus Caenarcaniphilales bacterium]|nr:tRNA dihydrouridine synthase DusB [Candidatus Caenarcaniphilales bacterium]
MPEQTKPQNLVQIENEKLEKIYIPPMAGVTDLVFRRLIREVLGDLAKHVRLSTEMISSKGMMYQEDPHRMRLSKDEYGKVIIQLFGHEPKVMAEAAQMAEKVGAAGIDINMGCPVPKITKGKDGAALMKEPCLAEEIVREVIDAVDVPVSVKTRLGWSEELKNGQDLSMRLQDAGISSLTIHGRTRAQAYSGQASWEEIRKINEILEIPVFANGDIDSPDKVQRALDVTGCHGVAIARASIGNPWIILQAVHKLLRVPSNDEITTANKIKVALRHAQLTFEDKGERGVQALKRHMSKYISGIPGASNYKQKLATAKNFNEMKSILQTICD